MREQEVKAGELIIKEGDDGDFFYVVDSGRFGVYKEGIDGCLKTETQGGYFGELALMYNAARAATIKAEEDSVVWSLDRESFRALASKRVSAKRQSHEAALKSIPLLQTLKSVELASIADALTVKDYEAGVEVVKQGDPGDCFFIIEWGGVEFVKDGQSVGRAATGGYFGELALLTDAPRAATVKTTVPSKLASLDGAAFARVLGPVKDLLIRDATKWQGLDPDLKKLAEVQAAATTEPAEAAAE